MDAAGHGQRNPVCGTDMSICKRKLQKTVHEKELWDGKNSTACKIIDCPSFWMGQDNGQETFVACRGNGRILEWTKTAGRRDDDRENCNGAV
jgi:hypothetical protein